ncbi:Sulfotransferase family protein [Ekhidna lutea]|uniref:Sulfotransferase family protein n=1 Tax=Ekhidna lutea TaxID=447679 RepID=A0A239M048_EKHLU|nr:sulfotransferase [Ekhidna lutea]SNT36061.1 Sulfotransferase family protein [Ekhidna lutea]
MKINQFINHIYWFSQFGRPKRKISSEELFVNPSLVKEPVFFLSTGRCGTEWFTHLLSKDKNTAVFHDPTPNLSTQNRFMHKLSVLGDKNNLEIAKNLLFAGREQYLRYAYKSEKSYVETNNHITFFAFALAELFPKAKFVHLYRHPGDFVTSGLNRGWFESNETATAKLITSDNEKDWGNYTTLEKIAWVWNETNSFIESFKNQYPNRSFSYDFTHRDYNNLVKLIDFLGLNIPQKTLKKALSIKKNVQKSHTFPSYPNWDDSDRKKLQTICGELSSKYQYQL